MDKLFKLEFGTTVKCYPYRKALVFGVFFEVDKNNPEVEAFEEELVKKSGARWRDNHTCYTITNRSGESIHISCSDGKMRFGSQLEERNW